MKFNTLLFFCFALLSQTFGQPINPDNITIARDKWGIPHIYAKTNPEVAFGVAWVQGEDHFEYMQQNVMLAKGLLGRVYGKAGAAGDFFAGLLHVDELIDERIETDISPEFLEYLEGYCAGINAYAAKHPKAVLHKKIFPVTPKDILFSYPAKIAQFIGMDGDVRRVLNGSYDKQTKDFTFATKGSNAFAFSKKMTKDGRTYLISNPHVTLEGLESFYEIHVVSEEGLNFHGAMFPGSVSPQVGTNPNLGWSHTNNYYDHTDVYLLNMHPTEPLKYEYDGKWLNLEEKKLKLKVKLKGIPFPVGAKRSVYWSKYGPTLKSKAGKFFAIRMAPILNIKAPEQWLKMNLAQNFEAFQEALAWDGLPYFNITYADKDDNIFYIFNGLFPKREPGFNWRGILPGNTSKTLWEDYIPFDQRPQIKNPDCGYVYNVNHNPFKCTCKASWLNASNYDTLVAYNKLLDDNLRSWRFREIYQDGTKLSMEELKAIKYDNGLPNGAYKKLFEALIQLDDSKHKELLDQLKSWNFKNDQDETAPTVAYLFLDWFLRKRPFPVSKVKEGDNVEKLLPGLDQVSNHLMKYFGKLKVPFKDFYRFKRGNKELPIFGGRGALAARGGRISTENGKFYANRGDQFMMFVEYDQDGVVKFESIVPFGSSSVPSSKHYTDQMELYTQQKSKPLTFDKQTILDNAERVYAPK